MNGGHATACLSYWNKPSIQASTEDTQERHEHSNVAHEEVSTPCLHAKSQTICYVLS